VVQHGPVEPGAKPAQRRPVRADERELGVLRASDVDADITVKRREEPTGRAGGVPAHDQRHAVAPVHRIKEPDPHELGDAGQAAQRADPDHLVDLAVVRVRCRGGQPAIAHQVH